MTRELGSLDLFQMYTRTIREYAQCMCERELQPYELLAYKQMCRTVQTWAVGLDLHLEWENSELRKKLHDTARPDQTDS